jgi:hypothetical protein
VDRLVEPPTFLFSGERPGPRESTADHLNRLDDLGQAAVTLRQRACTLRNLICTVREECLRMSQVACIVGELPSATMDERAGRTLA